MIVKDLIEKLQTMPPDAPVLHINYTWRRKTAFSDPCVFVNGDGECVLGAQLVSYAPEAEAHKNGDKEFKRWR